MTLTRLTALVVVVSLLFLCGTIDTEARHPHRHHRSPKNMISAPPTGAPLYSPPTAASNASSNSTNSSPPSSSPGAPIPTPAPTGANSYSLFDVLTYGAVGNGVSDDTEAFKTAWDSACQEMNPSMISVPKGYSFLIKSTIFAGPCQNIIIFQVDGTIVAPSEPDLWPVNSRRNWLIFYKADGLTLRGGGLIDGRGEKWWDLPCKPHKAKNGSASRGPCDSPVALRFFSSSNVTVDGLKVQDSPQFHFRFDQCRYVTVSSLQIRSPAFSPNTDGIHVEGSENVLIHNSVISNGDDCVSIGAGSLNIHIENVTCGPGHGISIGSLGKQNSRACVTNVTVRNAVIRHSDNGVRIKTWQGGSGSVSAVTFDNIHMDTVRNPIIIDQYYCLSKSCQNQTSNLFVSGVSYRNIKGTYDVRNPPVHFGCSDSVPCTNITVSEVELLPATGQIISDPFCWNVYGMAQTMTIPPLLCLQEGLPRSIMDIDSNKCY
ncbi:Pectin lyase-like superfamily protein [Rhynchospora pubera]|uniref:Pectin lyase-like superfamily protein n=1 Tax=Rhynchospora pubera TaxID=906938 RepID=A0AAV8ERX4_9POAL|nr:Pectin lyase-like superfamily protein [Rhynchospora pubera]